MFYFDILGGENGVPQTTREIPDESFIEKVNQLNIALKQPPVPGMVVKSSESESLNRLLVYDSDSSSSSEMMRLNLNWQKRADSNDDSSSSSSQGLLQDDESSSESEEEDEITATR